MANVHFVDVVLNSFIRCFSSKPERTVPFSEVRLPSKVTSRNTEFAEGDEVEVCSFIHSGYFYSASSSSLLI